MDERETFAIRSAIDTRKLLVNLFSGRLGSRSGKEVGGVGEIWTLNGE